MSLYSGQSFGEVSERAGPKNVKRSCAVSVGGRVENWGDNVEDYMKEIV